jgi:hypothetical protein
MRWKLSDLEGIAPPADNKIIFKTSATQNELTILGHFYLMVVYNRSKENVVNGHPSFHFGIVAVGDFQLDNNDIHYPYILLDWHGDKQVYITAGDRDEIAFGLLNGDRGQIQHHTWGSLAELETPFQEGLKAKMSVPDDQFRILCQRRTNGTRTPKMIAEQLHAHTSMLNDKPSCFHVCLTLWEHLDGAPLSNSNEVQVSN